MEEKIKENNLQSILKNLHGEKFISILEEHSINEESLKFITKSHLDVIIPRSRYGEQIIFEYHLKIWQQQQFASDNPSVSHNNSIFELPIPKTSVSEDILKREMVYCLGFTFRYVTKISSHLTASDLKS
ncbi:uncharacterized protein LOC142231654 isoform X2 [Haematobia irritans]|uniref:uncharacterized protein LOC142223889 isoform X2 n=1 Tax=Haematobia irritans TaxID=7368 RepID=UPI003F4FBA98